MKNRPKIVDIDDEQITQEVLPVDEQVDRKMLVEKTLLYVLDLNERERDVINLYFGEGLRSVEIAEHFGLSEPRISQIKRVALKKLAIRLRAPHSDGPPDSRLQTPGSGKKNLKPVSGRSPESGARSPEPGVRSLASGGS